MDTGTDLGKNRKVGKSRKVDVVKNKMNSLGLIYKKSFLNILVEKKGFTNFFKIKHNANIIELT